MFPAARDAASVSTAPVVAFGAVAEAWPSVAWAGCRGEFVTGSRSMTSTAAAVLCAVESATSRKAMAAFPTTAKTSAATPPRSPSSKVRPDTWAPVTLPEASTFCSSWPVRVMIVSRENDLAWPRTVHSTVSVTRRELVAGWSASGLSLSYPAMGGRTVTFPAPSTRTNWTIVFLVKGGYRASAMDSVLV